MSENYSTESLIKLVEDRWTGRILGWCDDEYRAIIARLRAADKLMDDAGERPFNKWPFNK